MQIEHCLQVACAHAEERHQRVGQVAGLRQADREVLRDGGDPRLALRAFGPDGRVPGGSYDSWALDTGGGLRPELTGWGLGREAISTGLALGARQFASLVFRMTIAAFSIRAQKAVRSLWFDAVCRFVALTNGWDYDIFTRPA